MFVEVIPESRLCPSSSKTPRMAFGSLSFFFFVMVLSLLSDYAFYVVKHFGRLIIFAWISYLLASVTITKILRFVCKPFDPKDKCVLLIGCPSDFDRSLVKKLTDDLGLHVFVTTRVSNGSASHVYRQKTTESIRDKDAVQFLEVNLEEEDSVNSFSTAFNEISKEKKLLGVIIHEAPSNPIRIDWNSFDRDFNQSIDVGVTGIINILRHILPRLRKDKGRAVFLTSDSDKPIQAYNTTGAVVNACMNAMIESVRREVIYFGVYIINIRPDCLIQDLLGHQDYETGQEKRGFNPKIREKAKNSNMSSKEKKCLQDMVMSTVRDALIDPYPEFIYLLSTKKSISFNWLRSTILPNMR